MTSKYDSFNEYSTIFIKHVMQFKGLTYSALKIQYDFSTLAESRDHVHFRNTALPLPKEKGIYWLYTTSSTSQAEMPPRGCTTSTLLPPPFLLKDLGEVIALLPDPSLPREKFSLRLSPLFLEESGSFLS